MSAIIDHDSAVDDAPSGTPELLRVLIALHEGVDSLSISGPLSVLSAAQHNLKDPTSEAFDISFCGPSASKPVMSKQGLLFTANMDYKEAHQHLKEFDMLIVPSGGNVEQMVKGDNEPVVELVKAYVGIQQSDPARERTLFSVDNGSHLLAKAGALCGLAATTHADSYIALELLGQQASAYESTERTDVMDDRYVVNNARFDLGDDLSANPFVITKSSPLSNKERRRSSNARKGSFALAQSNMRRESNARRAAMRLGGMRVVTSGAVASGLDAALYLVCALVSVESAEEVARLLGISWSKGVVVNSIDV